MDNLALVGDIVYKTYRQSQLWGRGMPPDRPEQESSVPTRLRLLLHDELERLWSDRTMTVVFVRHNVREAARLGDRIVLLSSRPGRVADEFTVEMPRPRRIDSPEVSGLAAQVTDRLREEVRKHA